MINPMQMILNQMINSPQIKSNPMAQNVINMAKNGDVDGIEQFGRNIAKEKGIDFDKEFANFKNQFHIK
jgi:hypothetical protein